MVETAGGSVTAAPGAADPVAAPSIPGPGAGFWKKQIELAEAERKKHEPWWDANLRAYAPRPDQSPEKYASEVNTNRDFTLVERKKADLFYQRPDSTLVPTPLTELPLPVMDPMTGQPAVDPQTGQPVMQSSVPAVAAHEQILNEVVGPDDIDVVRGAVHPSIFDVLCPSGIGGTVIGYEATTVKVETVDPLTGAPTVVDVPVHERFFWHHISPKQLIIPYDAKSTMWDRLPFLGYRFQLPLTKAYRTKFKLPDEYEGTAPSNEQHFDHGQSMPEGRRVFTGVELWYRSALYRDDIVHPEHLTHLVLVDGMPTPSIHEDCPYQTLDDRGQLTPDSMKGFPVHILNTRILTDSAYPPSDCTLIRPLANELNIFRKQMVDYRDAMVLRWMVNTDTLPQDALDKALKATIGGIIPVPAEAFAGEGAFKEMPHGSMPRESFTSNDYIDNDIARTTAIDAAGAGVQSTGSTTATEQQIIAANANARLDFERAQVLDWYLKGLNKLSTLVQRYMPIERAAAIVGPAAAQVWDQWRKTVSGALAFTAMPDSALRVDQAVDRRQAQEFYTYVANDPFVRDRGKLLERLFRKFHIDPTGIVGPPPPTTPAQPSTSFSFKGNDVVEPQAPIVVELLQQLGFKISPEAVAQSQGMLLQAQQLEAAAAAEAEAAKGKPNTAHGGKVAQMESLDKHNADAGMGMQGLGGVAVGGAGGIQ
jgi:hypothetical protein